MPRSLRAPILGAGIGLVLAGPARADEKQVCIAAAEDGQQSRLDGKLRAAREQFLVCARSGCPAQVRRDCSQWMSEVVAAQPTIVLGAKDAGGHDVVAARVLVDGILVADGLDGKPVDVDPGKHVVRFESASLPAVEQQILVRESEKGRAVTVQFGGSVAAELPKPEPAPPAAIPTEPPSARPGPSPWTWVLAGVGVAAVGVGTYLELSVNGDASSLGDSCHEMCPHGQVDPLVLKQRVFGPIAFGVGGVSLGVATYLFFARPGRAAKERSLGWSLVPSSRGAVGGVAGSF